MYCNLKSISNPGMKMVKNNWTTMPNFIDSIIGAKSRSKIKERER